MKSTTNAFFIQETIDAEWEVYFGDGVVGSSLIDGNIIILSYVVTNGADANGANTFTSTSSIGGFADISVITQTAAAD